MAGPFDLVGKMLHSAALQSHVLFAQRQTEASRARQVKQPEPARMKVKQRVNPVAAVEGRVIDEYTPLLEAEFHHPPAARHRKPDARQTDPGRIDILV